MKQTTILILYHFHIVIKLFLWSYVCNFDFCHEKRKEIFLSTLGYNATEENLVLLKWNPPTPFLEVNFVIVSANITSPLHL